MKSSENNIWNSIQHLKQKLHGDKLQLQTIRSQLNRSKSPMLRKKQNPNKQNQSYISNNASQYRNSLGGQKSNELELKRQHRKQLNSMTQNYENKLKRMAENYEIQIQKIRDHYQSTITQKNSYIELLESTIPECQDEPQTPRTARLNEIHQIKDHYQRIIRQAKLKYQSIIETMSEQNQELRTQLSFKNVTFKNCDSLVDHARQTLTKYMCSDSSDSRALFSTSHINYSSNNSDNRMRDSVIDNSERLSAIFRNKFKFNKGSSISKNGSSVSISIDDQYNSINTNWKQRSVYEEHPRILPTVHEKPIRSKPFQQNQ